MEENPLNFIFQLTQNNELRSNLISFQNIQNFFIYLLTNINNEQSFPSLEQKAKVILQFCNIIKMNRTIVEFFSSYNEKSIYLYLFEIYLNKNTNYELKNAIISLLTELRINIKLNKTIFEYIFQNLSSVYRSDEVNDDTYFNDNLTLLNSILGETENILKPRNYFTCNGTGKIMFEADNNKKIKFEDCLIFILSFYINLDRESNDNKYLCNIISIKLEKININFELNSKGDLLLKDRIIVTLPKKEWINLVLYLHPNKEKKLELFYHANGAKIQKLNFNDINWSPTEGKNSIEFFDNFYGEVTSIILFSLKNEYFSQIRNEQFYYFFKNNKNGIWKKKIYNEFIQHISNFNYFEIVQNNNNLKHKREISSKNLNKINSKKELINIEKKQKNLKDNLLFILTAFNYTDTCPNIIEDCLGKNHCFFYGNIRNHKYTCYQNKINFLINLNNLLPIAEVFLIHQKLANEKNFELYLQIIENILNYRKKNIKSIKICKFFKILCLFLEKYPKHLFTEKILSSFINIGKTMFSNDSEFLSKSYFKHILLNEKILFKYESNSQIKFWNYIHLFCQSDNTQICNFINMNTLSLLLRFYDREKYKEMCCQEHLDMFKIDFIKNKKVMNPSLNKKLLYIKNVLSDIMLFQKPTASFHLFKLLALDLSPCLIKFIINIFRKTFESHKNDQKWTFSFINALINNKFESIILNTFIHCLPDVRLDILQLLYEVNSQIIDYDHKLYLYKCEMLLKPFLLPNEIFYIKDNDNKEDKEEEKEKNEIIENDIEMKEEVVRKKLFLINKKPEEKYFGILVLKDEIYQDYINKLFSLIISWSLNLPVNSKFERIFQKKNSIKNLNILFLLFEINSKLNNPKFTSKLINSLDSIMILESNCFNALHNKKFMISLMDLTFSCFLNSEDEINGKLFKKCYNDCKNIIINIYINSLKYAPSNEISKFPSRQLELIFIWCDKIILNETNRNNKNLIYSFVDEILFEILTNFKINFETNMEFNINEKSDITNGYLFNNYIILVSKLYNFCFQFRIDPLIYKNSTTFIEQETRKEISLPSLFIYSMRIDQSFGTKINNAWIDFKYIYEIYHRIKFVWQKGNLYKKYSKRKKKNIDKFKKYKDIVDNVILNKSNKNIYKSELNFLFYQLTENDINIIEPVIKIIQIFMMCMISAYQNKNEDNEFLSWVKEFGKLLRFLIISSTNLTMKNQEKFYEKIQKNALYSIIIGIGFLRQCLITSNSCNYEIEKILVNNLLICLFILKFEINYSNSHKKARIFTSTKFNRNDISNSAVVMIFKKYVLNENEQGIFNLEYLENLLNEKNYYDNIRKLLYDKDSDLEKYFFKNQKIINLINEKYFCLYSYKSLVNIRFNEIEKLKDNLNCNYTEDLLKLLPLYEKELAKYSNNSLEKNLTKKHLYRKIKKNLFSWNGFWSDRKLFYEDNKKLKYRIKNHYTKSFMRPLLVPILDIFYYLPQFSSFNKKGFFNNEPKKIINLDLDIILKNENSNEQEMSENINNNSENDNFLRNIYINSNPKISEKLLKISNTLDLGKEEEEYCLIEEKSSKFVKDINNPDKIYFLSCLVTTSHHIKGVCLIDESQLDFKVFLNQQTGKNMNGINMSFTDKDDDYDAERKTCYGSYFMFHQKDKNLYKISIKYTEIKYIFRRKYYYKDSALEIYTTLNKSFYFNFKYDFDREIVIKSILKKLGDCNKIILDLKDTKDNFDNIIGYENILTNSGIKNMRKSLFKKNNIGISDKIKLWKKWEISSFELLMWLNIFGNRSYNDISQYPVFPWTLCDFEEPLKKEKIQNNLNNSNNKSGEIKTIIDYNYRDLSLPIGMLEVNEKSSNRKKNFILNFNELKCQSEEFEDQKPYYFGTNYSNPIYICNYLVRIFPFTNISIELQGHKLDSSDRIFFSVPKAFEMCMSLKTDVRELIPEFFYLPEIFINLNDINLGKKEDGEQVEDAITPCNNNKYKFVELMKNILENDKISQNLQNWIDLIFGFKSRGKDAELAKNIFSKYSYPENINLDKEEDKNLVLRYVEFGLIPNQITSKEFPKREKKEDAIKGKQITDLNANLKIYRCKKNIIKSKDSINIEEINEIKKNQKNKTKSNNLILNPKMFSHDKILIFNEDTFEEKKLNYLIFEKAFCEETLNSFTVNSENMMHYYFSANKYQNKCTLFCNKGKTLILGGFFDGSVQIIQCDKNLNLKKRKIFPFESKEPILILSMDEEEKYLFMGNSIGNIFIFKINIETFEIEKKYSYNGHLAEINSIHINNDLNLWVSSSSDGIINLFTLPEFKLVRSLKIKSSSKIEYTFLSCSTLPSIIIIAIENGFREIYSYSINGELLEHIKELKEILCPIIIKDLNFNEYLVYISNDNNSIIFRNLPFLTMHNSVGGFEKITDLSVNENSRILCAINNEDEQLYIVKDTPKKVNSN